MNSALPGKTVHSLIYLPMKKLHFKTCNAKNLVLYQTRVLFGIPGSKLKSVTVLVYNLEKDDTTMFEQ